MPYNVTIAGKAISIDFNSLPEVSRNKVIQYGLQQILADAGASITAKTDPDESDRAEKKIALAEGRLENLMNGVVAATRASTDPIGREAKVLATEHVKAVYREKGKTFDVKSDHFKGLVAQVAETDTMRDKANKVLMARAQVKASLDIDISDLM